MSDKLRNGFVVLMFFLMFTSIVVCAITSDERLYVPFIILIVFLSGTIMFSKKEERDDSNIKNSRRMTAQKAAIWAFIYFWFSIIMGLITNFNDLIFLSLMGISLVLSIIRFILKEKEEKDTFETIILNMGCTEKETSLYGKTISDKEMISKIEKFIAMDRADLNLKMRDKDGKTMLIHAARYGRAEVVKYLLDRHADIHAKDYEFFSVLHAGVMSKDIETVKVLLKAGAEVNAKNSLGYSPIMLGDYTTDLELFKILMAYGANSEQKNKYGVSAMDMFANSPEILEILSQR